MRTEEPSTPSTLATSMLKTLPATLPTRVVLAMVPPLVIAGAWSVATGTYAVTLSLLALGALLAASPRLVSSYGTYGAGHTLAAGTVAALVLPVAIGDAPILLFGCLTLVPFLTAAWLSEKDTMQWSGGTAVLVGLLGARSTLRGTSDDLVTTLGVMVAIGSAAAVALAFRDALQVVSAGTDPRHRNLEREYQSLLEALESALGSSAKKDRFLSLMSFELRTPLTAIMGYSELLGEVLEDIGTEHDVRETRAIEASSRRLLSVVDDILDLSQIGAGTLELRAAPIDLSAIVHHALETVLAEHPKINVSAEIAQTGLIMGDHERLGRIVSNLVAQVVKGATAGETLHVLLTGRIRAVSLIVESPPDRVEPSDIRRLRDGLAQPIDEKPIHLGLELAVADSLTRTLGGELAIDRGSRGELRFIVTLPVTAAFDSGALEGDAA